MKVFVFGAGATAGADMNDPSSFRAPLTNQLFDDEWAQHHAGTFSPHDLRQCREGAKAQGVESWLTSKWNAISGLATPPARAAEYGFFAATMFYLRNVLQRVSEADLGVSAYEYLLRFLTARDVDFVLVSFNYDTLLDRAVQAVMHASLLDFAAYSRNRLLKPHGSVNWFVRRRHGDPQLSVEQTRDVSVRIRAATAGLFAGPPLELEQAFVMEPAHNDLRNLDHVFGAVDYDYLYPLLFMPLTAKAYDWVRQFETSMKKEATGWFSHADDIYLIGYRGADALIDDFIDCTDKAATLHVVSGRAEDAQEVMDRLCARHRRLKSGMLRGDGFRGFVRALLEGSAAV